jgi:hypothetical protein
MKTKVVTPVEGSAPSVIANETPTGAPRRATITNVMALGQQLAEISGAARALVNRTPSDLQILIGELRRWYYSQPLDERDRRLWRRFLEAEAIYARLQHAIESARQASEVERPALAQAQAEREALAASPLPATVKEEATGTRPEAVRRYQALGIECQQRAAATTELEGLLPAPEQTLGQLPDVIARVLEAVVTVDREALVRRLRESGELEHLRSRFERLRTMANTHAAEIDELSRRVGRPLRVPKVIFPWPSAAIWDALLAEAVELPQLVWDEDPKGLST